MTRVDAEILTVADLAEMFACDKETAAARLTSGDLPGVKVGRGWIIPRQALFERLNEKAKEEAAYRRAQQVTTERDVQRDGDAVKFIPTTLTISSPSVLLPRSNVNQKGRRRREPPALPQLTEFNDQMISK